MEIKRQRNVYRRYSNLFREFISHNNAVDSLKKWFNERNIKEIIIYGSGASDATLLLVGLQKQLDIKINYIVENIKPGAKFIIPRLPESTINYPKCDAVIICNVDKPYVVRKKISEFLDVPIYEITEVLSMK